MRRLHATLPAGGYWPPQLLAEARDAGIPARDVNEVVVGGDTLLATYVPDGDTTTDAAWQAVVDAHTPAPPAEDGALIQVQLAALGASFLAIAPDLRAAVSAVANSNTAKTALALIGAAVQTAAEIEA